jgi:hypothetical protein
LSDQEVEISIASWDPLGDLEKDFLVYRMAVNYRAQVSSTKSVARDLVVRTMYAAEKLKRTVRRKRRVLHRTAGQR